MVDDCIIVIMTNNIGSQLAFYNNMLGLEIIFNRMSEIGLGIHGRLVMIIKQGVSSDSHHSPLHKGPILISFKCNQGIDDCKQILKHNNVMLRGERDVPEYNVRYLFIEDPDGNELCLRFYSN